MRISKAARISTLAAGALALAACTTSQAPAPTSTEPDNDTTQESTVEEEPQDEVVEDEEVQEEVTVEEGVERDNLDNLDAEGSGTTDPIGDVTFQGPQGDLKFTTSTNDKGEEIVTITPAQTTPVTPASDVKPADKAPSKETPGNADEGSTTETIIPIIPLEPAEPGDGKEPGDPVDPDGPSDGKEPGDPVDPGGKDDVEEPTDPSEPGDTDPVDPGETDPVDPDEPGDGEDTDPSEPGDTDPVDPDEGEEPTDPAEPGDGEDTDPVDPTDPEDPGDGDQGAVSDHPRAGKIESSFHEGIFRPDGLAAEDVTDVTIREFIRVYNEIRAAAGFDPVPVQNFRVGLDDWSTNVVAHANRERTGHEGAVWTNEVASGLGNQQYNPDIGVKWGFGGHSPAINWWNSEPHHAIIYQVSVDRNQSVPDVTLDSTCIVYNHAYTFDGYYDARAAVVPCENDFIQESTISAVDVDTTLLDYEAPEKNSEVTTDKDEVPYDTSPSIPGERMTPEEFQAEQDERAAHVAEAEEAFNSDTPAPADAAIQAAEVDVDEALEQNDEESADEKQDAMPETKVIPGKAHLPVAEIVETPAESEGPKVIEIENQYPTPAPAEVKEPEVIEIEDQYPTPAPAEVKDPVAAEDPAPVEEPKVVEIEDQYPTPAPAEVKPKPEPVVVEIENQYPTPAPAEVKDPAPVEEPKVIEIENQYPTPAPVSGEED